MKTYFCKRAVEAARWIDTPQNREAFASWFDEHDAMFETRGFVVDLSTGRASEGTWILFAGDEFVSLDDETFTALFTEAT